MMENSNWFGICATPVVRGSRRSRLEPFQKFMIGDLQGDRDPSPNEHTVPVRWRGFQTGPGNRHPLWRGLCILQKRRQRLRERVTCLGLFNQSIADSN